jgi:hypothetical protein
MVRATFDPVISPSTQMEFFHAVVEEFASTALNLQ